MYGVGQAPSLRNHLLGTLARAGYAARRSYPSDLSTETIDIVESVRPFTMTPPAAIVGLCEAVSYLVHNRVEGAIVECGVWRGGSVMAAAQSLLRLGVRDRDFYLFDTFSGMPVPGDNDTSVTHPSDLPIERWRREDRNGYNGWAYAPLELVRANVLSTGYPAERVHLIRGRVEETVPEQAPQSIALLRLDTDWYESTRHELEHLYPLLVPRGVLVLDDYGAWAGHRKAVDEYAPVSALYLARLGASARIAVKPSGS